MELCWSTPAKKLAQSTEAISKVSSSHNTMVPVTTLVTYMVWGLKFTAFHKCDLKKSKIQNSTKCYTLMFAWDSLFPSECFKASYTNNGPIISSCNLTDFTGDISQMNAAHIVLIYRQPNSQMPPGILANKNVNHYQLKLSQLTASWGSLGHLGILSKGI